MHLTHTIPDMLTYFEKEFRSRKLIYRIPDRGTDSLSPSPGPGAELRSVLLHLRVRLLGLERRELTSSTASVHTMILDFPRPYQWFFSYEVAFLGSWMESSRKLWLECHGG